MPRLEPRRAPPPDYYADNLGFLLEEVARRNGDLLESGEVGLIDGWRAATAPARRLLARLLTRRGSWFRTDRLAYPEVADRDAAIDELHRLGLIAIGAPSPADRLLDLFTRQELQALFPRVCGVSKASWITNCVGRYPDLAVRKAVASRYSWFSLLAAMPFAVCRLLFFGSDRRDMTEFVLQDLGLQRFEEYEIGTHTRPFGDRTEIEQYRACRRLASWLAETEGDADVAATVRRKLWHPVDSRAVARLRDRLLNQLGHLHERRGEYDEALESYGLSTTHPARERRARLLQRLGDTHGYRGLIAEAVASPWSAAEEDYALRCVGPEFVAMRAKPFNVTETAIAPGQFPGLAGCSIERHALAELTVSGGTGWHLENHFPLGLAGLLFWEEVFAPVPGAFSHPLQHGPRDLFWPDFARIREHAIAARVAELESPAAFRGHIVRIVGAKRGLANHLVHWNVWTSDLLDALVGLRDTTPLLALACHVIRDIQRARTGFPDLLIIRSPDEFEFVEVKGPTDQLQPAQRTWLRTLDRLGLPARVLKFRQ